MTARACPISAWPGVSRSTAWRTVGSPVRVGSSACSFSRRESPLTSLRVAELLGEAGRTARCRQPRGPQPNSGAWLDAVVDHRAVRMLSFTGSTEVGRVPAEALRRPGAQGGDGARRQRTVSSCSPTPTSKPATAGAMVAKMRHSAETCTAANRFFVEAPAHDEFRRTAGDGRWAR